MNGLPHKDKLTAAIANPKCQNDVSLLQEAMKAYEHWIAQMAALTSTGQEKVSEMVELLNQYKDYLEVDLIAQRGSSFIKRQKGQLKLDNSVLEEFVMYLVEPTIIQGLPTDFQIEKGPQTAFMSLSFRPSGMKSLDEKPDVVLKEKNQDFTIGKSVYYKFSASPEFEKPKTSEGKLFLAVLAAEIKVNYDKTMFQECAGTAARLKQGCPIAKYYALVEYLDMQPEDCRLTDIDNVFLLRKTKRLPQQKRPIYEEVRQQHQENPIDKDVMWRFVQEIQRFVDAVWYDADAALKRGSFV
jgi:hypothetical protein